MDRFRVSRISLIEKYGKPVNTELTGRMILRLFHGLSSCLPQLMFLKAASLSSPNCAISGPGRCGEARLCLTTGEKRHVRHQSCNRDVEVLGKIMDELARQIGAMNPDGRKRKVLIDEISE